MAKKLYKLALQLNSQNHIALNNLAYLLMDQGRDYNEIKDMISRSIEIKNNTVNNTEYGFRIYVYGLQPGEVFAISQLT